MATQVCFTSTITGVPFPDRRRGNKCPASIYVCRLGYFVLGTVKTTRNIHIIGLPRYVSYAKRRPLKVCTSREATNALSMVTKNLSSLTRPRKTRKTKRKRPHTGCVCLNFHHQRARSKKTPLNGTITTETFKHEQQIKNYLDTNDAHLFRCYDAGLKKTPLKLNAESINGR